MSNSVRPEIKKATYNRILILAGIQVGDRPSLEVALGKILKMVKMTPLESKNEFKQCEINESPKDNEGSLDSI